MQPPSPPKHLGHREGINERNAREKAAKQAELEEKKRERKRKIEEEMRYGTVPLTPKHKTRAAARTPGVRRETPARTPASRARVASKTPVSAKQKGKVCNVCVQHHLVHWCLGNTGTQFPAHVMYSRASPRLSARR